MSADTKSEINETMNSHFNTTQPFMIHCLIKNLFKFTERRRTFQIWFMVKIIYHFHLFPLGSRPLFPHLETVYKGFCFVFCPLARQRRDIKKGEKYKQKICEIRSFDCYGNLWGLLSYPSRGLRREKTEEKKGLAKKEPPTSKTIISQI